ncbi:ABC transporter permease [Listeria sp. PSOL-1]|uniref:ABC transporter permease n=1 Tax=Listeria sp. PSOL-1 TaxID=1844999 RepID=UPI0013D3AF3B|nr:ABC transporter permease [Listeria sp. PSOL-1]
MRVWAIVKRIINQFKRDKRTLALMLIAPLLLITLLNFLFDDSDVSPTVGVAGLSADMVKNLSDKKINVKKYSMATEINHTIKHDKLDGFIKQTGNSLDVTFENSDPSVTQEIKMKLQSAMMTKQDAETKQLVTKLSKQMGETKTNQQDMPGAKSMKTRMHYVYGNSHTKFFDTIGPIFIGFFVFFFVFLIAGISFLRERTTGTLERLMATPIKRLELELGYMIGFGIFALLQSVLVALYSVHVLGMVQNGSIWYVLLITLTLAIVSLALGMLLSTFANNEFQIIQFIPIVIVPQVLFCGIFKIEGMADWLQWIAHIMPMYYGATVLKGIMIKGETFQDFQGNFYILLLFAAVFLILNLFSLKKYRKA